MRRKNLAIFAFIVFAAASFGGYIGNNNVQLNILKPVKDRMVIQMNADGFVPREVSLYEGNDVCFVNADTVERWPASNNHPTHAIYPEFDPQRGIAAGEDGCFQFDLPGTWRFHDHLHPEFRGMVTVKDK